MARKRVPDPLRLRSWEEADALLGTLAEHQREVARMELDLTDRIAVLKNNTKLAVEVHQAIIADAEKQLALWAERHAEDFGKSRSRTLTHGIIGIRKHTEVKLLDKVAAVVALLRAAGHDDCIRQSAPQVDKQQVRKLTGEEMAAARISLVSVDEVYLEPFEVELPVVDDANCQENH